MSAPLRRGGRGWALWGVLLGLWALAPSAHAEGPAEPSLSLDAAIQRALARDPQLQASTVRIDETLAAERAADGAFDLVAELTLDAVTDRFTARDQTTQRELALDTTRLTLDAGLRQPLVWGTQLRAGWAQVLTATDNPFRNCVPGVSSDQCYETRLQLSVQQPLLRGFGRGVTQIGARRAQADRTVAQAERAAAAEALAEQVVEAYVELAYAREALALRADALALAERQLDTSQRRVAGGQLAAAELPVVAQAVAERARARFLAEQAVADGEANLAALIGPLASGVAVTLPELTPWTGGDADAVAKVAAEQHPELVVLDARLARQRAELPVLQDRARPRLDLSLVAAQTGIDDTNFGNAIGAIPDNGSHFYGATLAFDYPLANTSADAQVAEARLAAQRLRLEREAQAQALRRAAGSAWRRVETARVNERLSARVAALALETVTAEQRRFELGRSTNLAVLQVQQEAAEAALAVRRAAADRRIALAALRRLTGQLLAARGLALRP